MQILLDHWHCILPVLGIVAAMFFMKRDKDKEKKDGYNAEESVKTIPQNYKD